MPDEIIGMADMGVIFSVTDRMGIHRESVSVELTKEDPGAVQAAPGGGVEITVPASGDHPGIFPKVAGGARSDGLRAPGR